MWHKVHQYLYLLKKCNELASGSRVPIEGWDAYAMERLQLQSPTHQWH